MARKNRNMSFEVDSDLSARLGGFAKNTYTVLKATLYPAAGLLADEIRKNLASQQDERFYKSLVDSITIVGMKQDGGRVSTAVVFVGYDKNVKTKKYSSGVPNALWAAILESGTSKRPKEPFIRPAVNAVRERAEAAMKEEFQNQINNIMEGGKA